MKIRPVLLSLIIAIMMLILSACGVKAARASWCYNISVTVVKNSRPILLTAKQ